MKAAISTVIDTAAADEFPLSLKGLLPRHLPAHVAPKAIYFQGFNGFSGVVHQFGPFARLKPCPPA
jgi:hypothetical protein